MDYLIIYTGPAHIGTPTIGLNHYLEVMQYIETADTPREALRQWYLHHEGTEPTIDPDRDRIEFDGGYFEALPIIHRNKWCMILERDGVYILRSSSGKYNDQYFITSTDALKAIGVRA